jgi:DNA repair protein RecO (recombination protein O)
VVLYRDEAIVLRTHKLSDADRIITLLTRQHGKVRAVGNGVRRTTSRFGSRLEPFTHVDLQLSEGRSLHRVIQAEMLAPHGAAIASDYERYTAGTAMLETADRLTAEEGEPSTQQFRLLLGAVRAMAADRYPANLVLDAYLLRAMAVAGFAPSFSVCARCGAEGPHGWFSVPTGGMVCSACRAPGSVRAGAGTVALLAALLTSDWDTALTATAAERNEAHGMVAAYVPWHLDRGLRSLRHVSVGARRA